MGKRKKKRIIRNGNRKMDTNRKKVITLNEAVSELTAAANSFGNTVAETTKAIEVLSKVNTHFAEVINKHPFAKYFKQNKQTKR